jgi:trehalose/maltose transport system substrate-binding protein
MMAKRTYALTVGALIGTTIGLSSLAVKAQPEHCWIVCFEGLCEEVVNAWVEDNNLPVQILHPPAGQGLPWLQAQLAAGSTQAEMAVVPSDWLSAIVPYAADLNEFVGDEEWSGHFDHMIQEGVVNGELRALPLQATAGVLFYRADLLEKFGLEVPITWEELREVAQTIQEGERQEGNASFWGFVWEGGSPYNLTSNAIEWFASQGDGVRVDEGTMRIDEGDVRQGIELMLSWLGDITPEQVLVEDGAARSAWMSGNAALFQARSYHSQTLVEGKGGATQASVAPLPVAEEGSQAVAKLDGLYGVVLSSSDYIELNQSLIRFMSGEEGQKTIMKSTGLLPTLKAMYDDREVLEDRAYVGGLYDVAANGIVLPTIDMAEPGQTTLGIIAEIADTLRKVGFGELGADEGAAVIVERLRALGLVK